MTMTKDSKINVSDLKVNSVIRGFIAINSVQLATASNGKKYLNLGLTDGKNSIYAKKWDANENEVPMVGEVLKVDASVGEYRGTIQLVINRMRTATEKDSINKADFIATSPYKVSELNEELAKYINLIQDLDYKNLVLAIVSKYKQDFITAPAAIHHHHAFLGGTLEHTLEVCRNCITMADENLDLSLLIAGALLHDIGKALSYTYKGLIIDMTDAGKLLDHIVLGCSMVWREGLLLDMPKDKLILIMHLVASHHKNLEWGSPVTPKIPEAVILHQADYLSAAMTKIKSIEEESKENIWSAYNRDFGSILVKHDGNYIIDTEVIR